MGEGDDEHVAWKAEGWEGLGGGEGALGCCEVGFVSDGGDEVGCDVGVGEAEEALVGAWWGPAGTLAGAIAALVVDGEAAVGFFLAGEGLAFGLDGGQGGGGCAGRDG